MIVVHALRKPEFFASKKVVKTAANKPAHRNSRTKQYQNQAKDTPFTHLAWLGSRSSRVYAKGHKQACRPLMAFSMLQTTLRTFDESTPSRLNAACLFVWLFVGGRVAYPEHRQP